jgi:hypothetical protein
MGMRHTNRYTSRCAVRAWDAAQLESAEGFVPSTRIEGQLPRQLEPPV